jgi:Ser/Thr protein kinase RdoA (MazF antagonist)
MDFEQLLKDHFKNRKVNEQDIKLILKNVCLDYRLGKLIDFSKKVFGYQDFNLLFKTTQGRFFAKIFSNQTKVESQEYINLMLKVISSGVSYPKLLKSNLDYLYSNKVNGRNYFLCVQKYIDGKNFYELKSDPNIKEVIQIAKQAALINKMDYKPKYCVVDTWATRSLIEQYHVKQKAINTYENKLIEPILKDFKDIDLSKLPYCFTHGDLIHTNVMKDINGKIWIIDFGVASYQPRIMELAVLFHDLFIDLNSRKNTEIKRKIVLKEYQKIIKLTNEELNLLPLLVRATHVIYLLSSTYMLRVLKEKSDETNYWYMRSKKALELDL